MKKPKPKVLLTTDTFRIIQGAYPRSFVVEEADGRDGMHQRRWVQFRIATDTAIECRFRDFIGAVGRSLVLRAKRRRKS